MRLMVLIIASWISVMLTGCVTGVGAGPGWVSFNRPDALDEKLKRAQAEDYCVSHLKGSVSKWPAVCPDDFPKLEACARADFESLLCREQEAVFSAGYDPETATFRPPSTRLVNNSSANPQADAREVKYVSEKDYACLVDLNSGKFTLWPPVCAKSSLTQFQACKLLEFEPAYCSKVWKAYVKTRSALDVHSDTDKRRVRRIEF